MSEYGCYVAHIEMIYVLQIVMTANTVVLCYVASPRTPEEHAAASTVGHLSCSRLLHAVSSCRRRRRICVSCSECVMLQQIWSKESFQLIVVWGKKDMQLVQKRNICKA